MEYSIMEWFLLSFASVALVAANHITKGEDKK